MGTIHVRRGCWLSDVGSGGLDCLLVMESGLDGTSAYGHQTPVERGRRVMSASQLHA